MATTSLLPHPTHEHPLKLGNFRCRSDFRRFCDLCKRQISDKAYTCREGCNFNCHRPCAEAPPRIDSHPFHPSHSLTLFHNQTNFSCSACDYILEDGSSAFRCDHCDFILDLCCALATLWDQGGSPEGTSLEQIIHPLHPHRLTAFSTMNDNFVAGDSCNLCKESVEWDGHTCLRPSCWFLIHKRCAKDLYCTDGTKAPRIYHKHQLEIFVGEDAGSTKCAHCRSGKSGEFIGCSICQIFYHMDCIQGPEILQYPPHPHNSLVLVILNPKGHLMICESCFSSTNGELCYSCPYCNDFYVHVGCALQTVAYCEEGMSTSIKPTWHELPLFLCHGTESGSRNCDYCGDKSIGPMYACQGHCRMLLHKQCIQFESTISHYLHPDHPLTFATLANGYEYPRGCTVCQLKVDGFSFFCNTCAVYLHSRCAIRPTLKHSLHEHKLLHLAEAPHMHCNRCSASTDTPLLHCVSCKFNIHEKCAELPLVVKSDIHWHPLTLHEKYIEDDSGEYYCDRCEKRRDTRLGAYVCGQCSARWVYHIECVLPELQIFFANKSEIFDIEELKEQVKIQNLQVREAEEKLEEMKRVSDELKTRLEERTSEEEKNSVAATEEIELEKSS